eukprot:1963020-Amphidinium_carterae.1
MAKCDPRHIVGGDARGPNKVCTWNVSHLHAAHGCQVIPPQIIACFPTQCYAFDIVGALPPDIDY